MCPRPPRSPLFPYTTLFRSRGAPRTRQLPGWRWYHGRGFGLGFNAAVVAELRLRWGREAQCTVAGGGCRWLTSTVVRRHAKDRKSTRLNSSHGYISYAVFCLNVSATSALSALSLHDALPISRCSANSPVTRMEMVPRAGLRFGFQRSRSRGAPSPLGPGGPVHCRWRRMPLAYLDCCPSACQRSEEHTSELQSRLHLVCRLLLECVRDLRALRSFPTRRSSDLAVLRELASYPDGDGTTGGASVWVSTQP